MRNKGFTLIELMIVVSMIGLIASFSLSLYSSLNTGRNKQKGADDLAVMLNQARSYSLSQVNKCSSGSLSNYEVRTNNPTNACFSLIQNCTNPASSVTLDSNCLASGITFGSNQTFRFPVQGGAIPATSVTVTGLGGSITVSVDANGIITTQ
jgi:prepilin-type N-terminal cleavage/methylation domain-containing protein